MNGESLMKNCMKIFFRAPPLYPIFNFFSNHILLITLKLKVQFISIRFLYIYAWIWVWFFLFLYLFHFDKRTQKIARNFFTHSPDFRLRLMVLGSSQFGYWWLSMAYYTFSFLLIDHVIFFFCSLYKLSLKGFEP